VRSVSAEIRLHGTSADRSEAPRLDVVCCDDPTPTVGVRYKQGSEAAVDLYCSACDRTFAQLFPGKEA
jgi:hypothetical protein